MTLTEELTRNDTLWIKNHHVNYSKKSMKCQKELVIQIIPSIKVEIF